MKVVVDTNVIAYRLLRSQPFLDEARTLSWKAELANTVWLAVRHQGLDRERAIAHLQDAAALGIESVDPAELWEGAVKRAIDHDHPAYDRLFVELAVRERVSLATFDRRIRELFPEIAKLPGELAG